MKPLTSKAAVLAILPMARLDFYESLRGDRKPCWFIRVGFQGAILTSIYSTPAQAWRAIFTETATVADLLDLRVVFAHYPWAYAAFLGKGRNRSWIIRDAHDNFFPLTAIRRATQAEAWSDLATALNKKAVAA